MFFSIFWAIICAFLSSTCVYSVQLLLLLLLLLLLRYVDLLGKRLDTSLNCVFWIFGTLRVCVSFFSFFSFSRWR